MYSRHGRLYSKHGAVVMRKPLRPCNHPGCRTLTENRLCDTHQRAYRREQDRWRGSASERGYTHAWHKARNRYLRDNPLCTQCKGQGVIKEAGVVDHIIPHKGNNELFWDESNWQSLCTRHHNIKTATKDSSFANKNKT